MRSGQVTVLVLLLAMLGLTATLSVASRSLSDLKQVSYVDTGTKAFAGAEAGLQFALNDFTTNNDTSTCATPRTLSPTDLNVPGINHIDYSICSNNSDYLSVHDVGQDEVVQADFPITNPNNVESFDILWSNNNAAVEVIMVDKNDVVTRSIYNGQSILARASANSFSDSVAAAGCLVNNCNDTFFTGGSCASGVPYSHTKLIRVRPIYGASGVAVCAKAHGHSPGRMDNQVYTFTVTATTTNNSKASVQAIRQSPALPSIFDHAIYTRGNLVK
jgi:hypothetical protein